MEDGQYRFRLGRITTEQIFFLKQIYVKSWKYAKNVIACFVDQGKAYDRVPRESSEDCCRSMAMIDIS